MNLDAVEKMKPVLIVQTVLLTVLCDSFQLNPRTGNDPAEPLILTPYIEANDIKSALELAEIKSETFLGIKSYSGYFTVDEAFNSNSFFWFFPAETNYESAPVVLWLDGGPGASSLWGLFTVNGPYIFNTTSGNMELRKYSWHKNCSLLYIDNPVGTGYSFTEGGYAQNETIIGEHLYSALEQFYKLFPELRSNDFYPIGESYAGKYVPAIAHTIHHKNPQADNKINMKGFVIWNALIHPELQMDYSDYLFQIGLIDSHGKEAMLQLENQIREDIRNENYGQANDGFYDLLHGYPNKSSLFTNLTGFTNFYNYLIDSSKSKEDDLFLDFIVREDVRKDIHVGGIQFNDPNVALNLREDVMRPITDWLSELLSFYKGMLFNGQTDIIVAYPLTINFLNSFDFSGAEEYKVAERKIWYVEEELAGYIKKAGNLTEALVRNAGHMAPQDQPKWCFDLVFRFINDNLA